MKTLRILGIIITIVQIILILTCFVLNFLITEMAWSVYMYPYYGFSFVFAIFGLVVLIKAKDIC